MVLALSIGLDQKFFGESWQKLEYVAWPTRQVTYVLRRNKLFKKLGRKIGVVLLYDVIGRLARHT